MAVKIKLTRLGKIRNPQYRVVIAEVLSVHGSPSLGLEHEPVT